ncbi:type II toxin-antitoxin system Phd/YefM family antitoxin [Anabaena sp. WFMT]|uniref:type II toxin-antitoxin system Phd/YefM family antitoxin n=1 Tax=Anabaena sp. WFMT TaxID=3449730 RepID=UPI003F26AF90
MTQITLAELPKNLQILLNQAQKTGKPLTIIQNGIPFAIISPIKKNPYCKPFPLLKHWTKTLPTWTQDYYP